MSSSKFYSFQIVDIVGGIRTAVFDSSGSLYVGTTKNCILTSGDDCTDFTFATMVTRCYEFAAAFEYFTRIDNGFRAIRKSCGACVLITATRDFSRAERIVSLFIGISVKLSGIRKWTTPA